MSERAIEGRGSARRRLVGLGVFVLGVTVLVLPGLVGLFRYALDTELHSYVVLVPVVVGWLLWSDREHLRGGFGTSAWVAAGFGAAGMLGVLACWRGGWWFGVLEPNDKHSLLAGSYVCLLVAGGFLFLGRRWMCRAMFPVCFLAFMIPLPDRAVVAMEQVLMVASAEATSWLFQLTGTPVFRLGQDFHLPGFSLSVAQECSGIRSSWVLLISSLFAAHLFLRAKWRKTLLVLFVIPLGILRNGLRIVTIGLLCVHRGPHMIDSWIHHSGGPFFFGLSLVPLFVLLWWLRWSEREKAGEESADTGGEEHAGDMPSGSGEHCVEQ